MVKPLIDNIKDQQNAQKKLLNLLDKLKSGKSINKPQSLDLTLNPNELKKLPM